MDLNIFEFFGTLVAKSIDNNIPIRIFNNGDLFRDFTYIDDIVDGIVRVVQKKGIPVSRAVYNIGCSHPINLMRFIQTLERSLGAKAQKIMMPMQPGDVYQTFADTSALKRDFGIDQTLHWKSV